MTSQFRADRPPFVQLPESWLGVLTPSEITVAFALAAYANRGGSCWPSTRAIAERTGLSRRTICTVLAALEEKRVIGIQRRRRPNGADTSNVYVLDLTGFPSPPAGCADSAQGGCENPAQGGEQNLHTQGGAEFAHQESDPFQSDPSEPDTPLTPHGGAVCPSEPAAEPEPNPEPPNRPVDGPAMRHQHHPWLNSRNRPVDEFVEFVIRALPKKDDRAEALNNARAYVRKVDHVEGRLDAVLQLWEDFQQHLTEKAEAERRAKEDAEIEALLARRW